MQTIENLNKKIWYRIVKVLYFGIFFFVLLIGGMSIYDETTYYPYNENETHISCTGSYDGVNIKKSIYGITGNSLTLDQKKAIGKDICGADPAKINSFELFTGRFEGDLLLSKNEFFTASQGVMEQKIHPGSFIEYFSLLLIGLGMVFEIIRRVFYYIVFGTFRPKE